MWRYLGSTPTEYALACKICKPQAANAGVAHAVDADFLPLVYEDAVVPMLKSRPDRCQRVGVLNVEELESPFGKDQAEAECGIGWILLENFNLDFQFAALEQVGKIKAGGSCPDDCDSHRHFLLGFAAVFATDLRGYSCLAGGSERLAMISGDGLSLNRAGPFRMRGSPNPFLKAFDHKLSILQYTVPHCEAGTSPLAYLALHDDLVIKAARHNKLRSHFHYRHANDPIFLPHGERLQAGAFEQPSGARVEDEEVLRIKHDRRDRTDHSMRKVRRLTSIGFSFFRLARALTSRATEISSSIFVRALIPEQIQQPSICQTTSAPCSISSRFSSDRWQRVSSSQ